MSLLLLDANVLIAAVVAEHEHHGRVSSWLAGAGPVAVCPVVEGALVRFLVRLGETAATAVGALRLVHAVPTVTFVPDDLSYVDAGPGLVQGHRQVTDAYLVALAAAHGGRLATLDDALVATWPGSTVLVPAGSA